MHTGWHFTSSRTQAGIPILLLNKLPQQLLFVVLAT
jgi:hypothetical protein